MLTHSTHAPKGIRRPKYTLTEVHTNTTELLSSLEDAEVRLETSEIKK